MFKVIGSTGIYNYVEKKNLERVKCKCGGKLSISTKEKYNHDKNEEILLQCNTCKGKYVATNGNSADFLINKQNETHTQAANQ